MAPKGKGADPSVLDQRPFLFWVAGLKSQEKMASPEETYRAAILRACGAHLARVKAARDARALAVSKMRKHYSRAVANAAANEEYDKAIRNSDAQRAKDDAKALATLHAHGPKSCERP